MDWTSIICAVVALLGTAIGSYSGLRLTSYRVEQLEKKVEKHNNLISRTYELEKEYSVLDERIRVANHRIEDLEKEEVLHEG